MEIIPNRRTYGLYFLIWSGQVVSLFSSIIIQFTLIFWLTDESGSVFVLRFANILYLIPTLILTFFGGVLIDRYDRRMVLLISFSLKVFLSVILFGLFFLDLINVQIILVFLTLRTISLAFDSPTMMAITPSMVPKKSLGRVNGINNQVMGIIRIVSPFLASTYLFFIPLKFIFLIEIVASIIAIIPIIIIKIPKVYRYPRKNSYFKELGIGFKLLIKIPGLFIIMLIAIIVSLLLLPLSSFMALYIINADGGNTLIYSLIAPIIPIVSTIGALIPIIKRNWKRKTLVIFISILTMNIGYLLYALAPFRAFGIIISGLIAIGFTLPLIEIFSIAICQTVIPKDKIGRFSSIYLTISIGLTPLIIYLIGPIANLFGIIPLFLICAFLGIILGITTYLLTDIRSNNFDNEFELNLS